MSIEEHDSENPIDPDDNAYFVDPRSIPGLIAAHKLTNMPSSSSAPSKHIKSIDSSTTTQSATQSIDNPLPEDAASIVLPPQSAPSSTDPPTAMPDNFPSDPALHSTSEPGAISSLPQSAPQSIDNPPDTTPIALPPQSTPNNAADRPTIPTDMLLSDPALHSTSEPNIVSLQDDPSVSDSELLLSPLSLLTYPFNLFNGPDTSWQQDTDSTIFYLQKADNDCPSFGATADFPTSPSPSSPSVTPVSLKRPAPDSPPSPSIPFLISFSLILTILHRPHPPCQSASPYKLAPPCPIHCQCPG